MNYNKALRSYKKHLPYDSAAVHERGSADHFNNFTSKAARLVEDGREISVSALINQMRQKTLTRFHGYAERLGDTGNAHLDKVTKKIREVGSWRGFAAEMGAVGAGLRANRPEEIYPYASNGEAAA